MTYKLSAVLVGHETDVKAVVAPRADIVVSASRDTSVIVWKRVDKQQFDPSSTLRDHSHFVNALAYLPSSAEHSQGLIASGGSDKVIQVYDLLALGKPVRTLVGHSENVCVLGPGSNGDLLSGSWDCSAKLWRDWKCLYTVTHKASVWAVLAWDTDTFLTGSADRSIKLWKNGKEAQIFSGHTDAVRSLGRGDGNSFFSCSNDSTIRQWSINGDCMQELSGHTSFIYSLAVSPTTEVASCGEDRSVRIWNGTVCTQTIVVPCTSVWSVTYLPNGDIACGGSDAVVRIFTQSEERVANAEVLQTFNEAVAAQAIPSSQLGDVDKSKLPKADVLDRPGAKDQQVIMVNMGDRVEAHQWSEAELKWHKIGDVVDAVGSNRKAEFGGKDYDFVFDVDIGDGVPPLKLPYNVSDNPFKAAQDFIWANELPQDYLEQIADFIVQNAKGAVIGADASSGYQDPFTGGNRYVPGTNDSASRQCRSSRSSVGPMVIYFKYRLKRPSFIDPPSRKLSADKYLLTLLTSVQREYVNFKVGNIQAILSKFVQLNAELEKSMVGRDFTSASLSRTDENALETMIKALDTPNFASAWNESAQAALMKSVLEWPATHKFPAIDLLRLVVVHKVPTMFSKDIVKHLDQMGGFSRVNSEAPSKADVTNLMLTLRLLANLFTTTNGQDLVYKARQEIVDLFKGSWRVSDNKNLRIAFATVCLNFAVLLKNRNEGVLQLDLLNIVLESLSSETDGEAQFRELVALGTLIHESKDLKEAAKLLSVSNTVKRICQVTGSDEVQLKNIEKELLQLLR
ncbi:WD40-repeat-containing domain protein [Phlyctochytrium arcticum]|nr:WD40-repeat-containing domain protein [Phlyctochytrium arcticum]